VATGDKCQACTMGTYPLEWKTDSYLFFFVFCFFASSRDYLIVSMYVYVWEKCMKNNFDLFYALAVPRMY